MLYESSLIWEKSKQQLRKIQLKTLAPDTTIVLCGRDSFWGRRLGEQFAYRLREAGSLAGPVFDAVALQLDGGGVGAGVIGAHHFDGAAVAGAVLLNDNDAIVGLLARSNAREADHQHREFLSETVVMGR
jgi:hypothetical protein